MIGLAEAQGRRGFTLIEVILAIGMTIGLMLIVLFFYQQASRLRQEVLVRLEGVTAARLLQERLTRELRTARPDPFLLLGLRGGSNSIEFVCADWPRPVAWGADEALGPLPSDLKIVRYHLVFGDESTNATGIARAEEGLLELPPVVDEETLEAAAPAPPVEGLLTERLRYFELRYWSGTNWVESWNEAGLPGGVEITLAANAPVLESDEVFRRVVYLPGSGPFREASQVRLGVPEVAEGPEPLGAGEESP